MEMEEEERKKKGHRNLEGREGERRKRGENEVGQERLGRSDKMMICRRKRRLEKLGRKQGEGR